MRNTLSTVPEFTGLNSSSNPNACPVCSHSGPFPQRPSPEGFRLFECGHCGIVFLFPQPAEAQLDPFYDTAYYGEDRKKFFSPIEAGITALTVLKWNKVRPLLGPGDRLLDIGCGRGTLIQLARDSGFEAYGIERPSPVGHSVPGILYKTLPECSFPDAHFQVVTLWHVLEHLPNPVAALQEINRILKPDGYLSVAVPNYGGAQAKASGPHWFHLDLPRHFWHFRLQCLQDLLARTGFQVMTGTTLSIEYDWFGTVQSWMNSNFNDQNCLYSLLKGCTKASFGENVRRVVIAASLSFPGLASVLWDAARKDGGTLTLIAQKLAPRA